MIKENGHTNLTNIYKYYNYNLHIVYVASCNNLLIRNSSADHLWQPEGLCKDPAQRGNTAKHERATQCHSVIKMYDGNKSLYVYKAHSVCE